MFVEITNEPRDYAWGSTTLIPELLGIAPTGRPQAELWLGTHSGSPSRLVGPKGEVQSGDLRDIAGELPFLLKILAAGSPLSLQAHPTAAQAQEGFARENAAGIPIDAPHRNYKDTHAKPEMIYALSDGFRALCGFRPVSETRAVLDAGRPGLFPELRSDADIQPLFEWLLSGHPDVASAVSQITNVAVDAPGESWATVRLLAEHYPGDPGIAISLLLHSIELARGEALYLPAGTIHAYLSGLGVELMGPSDNVLRCALTPKHVDVPELLRVVDFTPTADPRFAPTSRRDGVATFAPADTRWKLSVLAEGAREDVVGPAIVVVLAGSAIGLDRGRSAYLADETIEVSADGLVVVATASA